MDITTVIDYLPNNKNVDLNLYLLDPLSTIIKLSILSNKPIGTKISIGKNVIYFQEPGPFQAFCRYIFNSNKTDIQYIYNPIELACQYYLSDEVINQHPKIPELFKFAQKGLSKLMETYKNSSVMRLCLNYYYSLISNHLEKKNDTNLFRKDNLTACYTVELQQKWRTIWTQEKLKIILNMISYLSKHDNAETEVKSLETIMESVDKAVQQIY
jgi:hypothetical protein